MKNDGYGIIRDSVNGINKYCRIPIRRRRAPVDESVAFLKQNIADLDDMAKESEGDEEEIHLIRNAQACILTALDSLLMLADYPEVPPNFFCGLGEPEVKDDGKI